MHRYKDLQIWKLSRAFCTEIYTITDNFPKTEKFGLINQLRRAAVFIPSNISKGCSRKPNKDFGSFLEIAIGSMYEIETQLLISSNFKFIFYKDLTILIDKLESIITMTSKFKSTLN